MDEAPVSMEGSDFLNWDYDIESFDVKGDLLRPAVDCLKPDLDAMFGVDDIYNAYMHDYTIDQPSDHVYSAWVDM